jgi:hypothetical protein
MTKSIPLSQGKFALVDDEDFEYLNQWKWHCHHGYAERSDHGFTPVRMHREIIHTPTGWYTDHVNGNPLDNRKINLRACTASENQHNSKLNKDNTSGYKGVYFNNKQNKWYAKIRVNGKLSHLGYFNNPIDAAHAYDIAAVRLFGRFAKTNYLLMRTPHT